MLPQNLWFICHEESEVNCTIKDRELKARMGEVIHNSYLQQLAVFLLGVASNQSYMKIVSEKLKKLWKYKHFYAIMERYEKGNF